jgi:hypothetical protein
MHAQRQQSSNFLVGPFLTEIVVGERLVIGLVFELLGIGAQLTRRKLGKKKHPDHGGRHQRPTAAMMTPPRRRVVRQSSNTMCDKSMSLKLKNIIIF